MPNLHFCRLIAFASILVFALPSLCRVFAQDIVTAAAHPVVDRNDGLSTFATYSQVNTDYGRRDVGMTFGLDITRNYEFLHLIVPSIEARYVHSVGNDVTEDTFLGGFKAERPIQRFHPYANLEIGYGKIHFKGSPDAYTEDNSVVYDVGVGLDYRVNRMFLIKLDAQQQYWKLGTGNSELEPYNLSAGIVYRIPFGFGHIR